MMFTSAQFDALAQLLRLTHGRECASLVLVDGLSITQAASTTGTSYRAAAAQVQRVRHGYELALIAAGQPC